MSTQTPNYKLEKYSAGDSANLLDDYNLSMDKIDTALHNLQTSIPSAVTLPDGLAAFFNALGVTSSNATQIGQTLSHIINKTPATTNPTFTVDDLAKAQKTAEGHVFIPTAQN